MIDKLTKYEEILDGLQIVLDIELLNKLDSDSLLQLITNLEDWELGEEILGANGLNQLLQINNEEQEIEIIELSNYRTALGDNMEQIKEVEVLTDFIGEPS